MSIIKRDSVSIYSLNLHLGLNIIIVKKNVLRNEVK